MKQFNRSILVTTCVALSLIFTACNNAAEDKTTEVKDSTGTMTSKPDNQSLKAEIQALENEWAKADNAGDATALAAFYSDDAVTLSNNKPMITGNAAIKKDMEDGMAKRPKGSTVAYDVMDAYGCDNYVTEVGKITRKDSTGKSTYTGKYMAIWEKRNGKWVCIRDISNDDVKEK